MAIVRSHHRRGWRPWTAIIGNGLWQKSMCLALVCSSDVDSSVGSRFQRPHWAPVAMVRSHHRRGWKPCTDVIGHGLWQTINVFSLVVFVRRQFKRWGLISNTTLGPSGHGKKPPSSRLGTLYSNYRRWFVTKSMYLAWFCLSDVNSSVGGRFQTPHWAPVAMVWSHHRRGWRPCTAIIGDGLWQKSMCLALVCSSDVDSSVGSRFQLL